MSNKATPKSCKCRMCMASKSSDSKMVKCLMKSEERASRHNANQEVRVKGLDADVLPAGSRSRLG